jgi:isoaspartyl peptidase/L-asparaginase-like protein (Ntn-hydrolase superfamily)
MEAAYWGPMGSARRLRALFREWILLGERERGEREREKEEREKAEREKEGKRERGERKREREKKSEKQGQIGAVAAVRRPMRRTVK